jgi:hypothetical protein
MGIFDRFESDKDVEKKTENLRLRNEETQQELELAQKRALISKAKQEYGIHWKKIIGMAKGLHPNQEAIHTMYGVGLGDLKEEGRLKPRKFR